MYPSTPAIRMFRLAHAGCDAFEEGLAELVQVLELVGYNLLCGGSRLHSIYLTERE
jgi:hypothetical protein